MAIKFELGDKAETVTVLRPYLEVDRDGDLVVRCNDDNGISWALVCFRNEGTLVRMGDVPPERGFKLDRHGRIELDE